MSWPRVIFSCLASFDVAGGKMRVSSDWLKMVWPYSKARWRYLLNAVFRFASNQEYLLLINFSLCSNPNFTIYKLPFAVSFCDYLFAFFVCVCCHQSNNGFLRLVFAYSVVIANILNVVLSTFFILSQVFKPRSQFVVLSFVCCSNEMLQFTVIFVWTCYTAPETAIFDVMPC